MNPKFNFPSNNEITEFSLVAEVWKEANKSISFWKTVALIGWVLAVAELVLRLV